ncbi:MAG: hypothetical protein H6797_03965 [Candidatus Nomurabacteria bacterium]|nr:MAG: hypothetical protein H6797_03965 [Candidatus Nomurabacteria bacterium]
MDLQQRLDQLTTDRNNYECKDKERNRGKHVIALLGASAVGKSTIIGACKERAFDWGIESIAEAGTTGTRAPRPGDPSNYNMGVPREEAIDMIEQGEPANWSLMPTGEIYLTLPSDFPAQYNFMACLPDSIPMLKRAGFDKIHSIYVVTEVDAWVDQLASRLYTADTISLPEEERQYRPDALGRVEEAISSLEYAMSTCSILKISNTPGEEALTKTADAILATAKGLSVVYAINTSQLDMFEKNAREMYSRAIDIAYKIRVATQK